MTYHPALADLLNALPEGAQARLRVVSSSMAPWLQPGDEVTLLRLPLSRLRCGDLVVVQRSADFVTHRLILVKSGWVYTKGDRLPGLDAPASPEQVLGRVVAIQRGRMQRDLAAAGWVALHRLIGFWQRLWIEIKMLIKRSRL